MARIITLVTFLVLALSQTGCRLTYVLHAAEGQWRILSGSIPLEEAMQRGTLSSEQRERIQWVPQIKEFAEKELGLKRTRSYESIYMGSKEMTLYLVSAAPKDRLTPVTWWFPVVGDVPYLGFFDLEGAQREKRGLEDQGFDTVLSLGAAYSTLGWFRDPLTQGLMEGSRVEFVDTLLHEMTHETLYVKGSGEFNEGLAVFVARIGTALFFERTLGPSHPDTMEARKAIEDERLFSGFLGSLLEKLGKLYASPRSREEKLARREEVFSSALEDFSHLKDRFQTRRFLRFGKGPMNNATLLSMGIYHRHFLRFEKVFHKNNDSVRQTIAFFGGLTDPLTFLMHDI